MLLGALTVLVVLATGENDATTTAMQRALDAALPEGARVIVRSRGDGAESSWLARGREEHAALVAAVTWSERQRRVLVRFVRPDEGRWSDREIQFDATDAAVERGRTVGFALASMVPEDVLAGAVAEADARGAARAGAPSLSAVAPAGSDLGASLPRAPEGPAPTPLGARNRLSVEAMGVGAVAVGGYGGGLGAALRLRLPTAGGLRLHVAASARAGDVGPAQASSRVLGGSAGVSWQGWVDLRRRWSAGVRLDALVQHHELVHFSADDPQPRTQARWLAGAAGAVEAGWRFTEQAAVVGAFGLETVFGTSAVVVSGRSVAEITPVRLVGETGLRVSF